MTTQNKIMYRVVVGFTWTIVGAIFAFKLASNFIQNQTPELSTILGLVAAIVTLMALCWKTFRYVICALWAIVAVLSIVLMVLGAGLSRSNLLDLSGYLFLASLPTLGLLIAPDLPTQNTV